MNPLRRSTDTTKAPTRATEAFAQWWADNKTQFYPLKQERAWEIFRAGWWAAKGKT